jgi:hypothetical protein
MKITDIIAESKQPKEAPKPRNFVAKNAINTGAGQHKDKKRAEKQGDVKHKKQAVPMDEQGVAEGEKAMSRAAKGNEKYGKDGMKALAKAGRDGASEKKLDKIRDKHDKYDESATAGATSAANVAVGPIYKNKPAKAAKNKDGTAKNALDMKANLLTGGSIKR